MSDPAQSMNEGKESGHSEQWWLHQLDMEKSAAWQQGYAQGFARGVKEGVPSAAIPLSKESAK